MTTDAIEARIAANRARRSRAKKLTGAAVLVALASRIGIMAIDAPDAIQGVAAFTVGATLTFMHFWTERNDEAVRARTFKVGAASAVLFAALAITDAIAVAMNGDTVIGAGLQLQIVGTGLLLASLLND